MEINKKLKQEAEEAGLELLGEGKNSNYRLYRFKDCGHKQEIQLGHVRNNSFKCQKCLDRKFKQEAEEAGLELLGKGKNCYYRLYRFKDCGHKQEIHKGSIRNKEFKCQTCIEEKLKQEAEEAGLELLGKGKNRNYRLYKFTKCGHEQEIQSSHVRIKNFKCQTCIEEKLKQEAEEAELELLEKGKTKDYRLYKFKDCGHKQEIRLDNVRNKNFKCQRCFEEKLKQEAEEVELELLGEGKNSNYRLYKFKDCGHEQEITLGGVRVKSFKCRECNGVWLKDGSLVKSYLEKLVGDWLIEEKIEYTYEKRLSSKSRHKTDFYLVQQDTYIEVAGYIEEISIKSGLSPNEIILELKKDPKNYKGYTEKLIDKINKYYLDKKLIVLTAKNLRNNKWKDDLAKSIKIKKG